MAKVPSVFLCVFFCHCHFLLFRALPGTDTMPQRRTESHSQKSTKKSRRRRHRIHRRKNAALPSRTCGGSRAAYLIFFFDSLGVRITSVEKIGVLHLFCAPLAKSYQLFGNRIFRNFSSWNLRVKRENTALSCGVFSCCIFWQHDLSCVDKKDAAFGCPRKEILSLIVEIP